MASYNTIHILIMRLCDRVSLSTWHGTHSYVHQRQPFEGISIDVGVTGILPNRLEEYSISTHEQGAVHLVPSPAAENEISISRCRDTLTAVRHLLDFPEIKSKENVVLDVSNFYRLDESRIAYSTRISLSALSGRSMRSPMRTPFVIPDSLSVWRISFSSGEAGSRVMRILPKPGTTTDPDPE